MSVLINHAISFLTSPLSVSLALILLGLILRLLSHHKQSANSTVNLNLPPQPPTPLLLIFAGLAWLYLMSTGLMYNILGLNLEREFPPQRAEDLPTADAIAVLGGGVGGNTNTVYYTELYGGGDRVLHAARLYRAGKAPVVIPSGAGELVATRPLLLELGVPESAILTENEALNTEQNAKFIATFVKAHHNPASTNSTVNLNLLPQPRILLVTSAWHMRRSLLLFQKYAPDVEVIPAACDYEATLYSDEPFDPRSLLPDAAFLLSNSCMLKEYIGYWGYRLLR